jgi:protein-tyrosine phosphatase
MKIFNESYKRMILDRFGSRRGAIRTYWHKLKYSFGIYRDYSKVDWSNIDRLVFVCKGNICRSAYAEVVAKSLGVDAISCGISTRNDFPANADAIRIAAERGTDLSEHRTTPAMYVLFKKTDLIVALEPWQAATLTENLQRKHYITLLGLWLSPLRPHVPDPYGLSDVYFNNCFDYIENAVNEITKKIKNS